MLTCTKVLKGLTLAVIMAVCAGFQTNIAASAAGVAPFPAPKPPASIPAQNASLAHDIPAPPLKPVTAETVGLTATVPVPVKKPDHIRPVYHGKLEDLHRKIFTLQAAGRWDEADKHIAMLPANDILRGHILYQRYMHPSAYRSSFEELSSWLDLYNDHPGADRIYRLAQARKPKSYEGYVTKPQPSAGITGFLSILSDRNRAYRSPKKRTTAQRREIQGLAKKIRHNLKRGAPTRAYKTLLASSESKHLDRVEYDDLRAQIANSYLVEGKIDKAYELATASSRGSDIKVPLAGWVAGLAAWRQGQYAEAASFFSVTANSPYASTWTSAASAYWASRSYMRAGKIDKVNQWLRRAALHPRTFYGLIATRALGWDFDFNWNMPSLTRTHKQTIVQDPAGKRALALLKAGQYHMAEQELFRLETMQDKSRLEALIAYANSHDLPALAMKIAEAVPGPDGSLLDAALYPLCPWEPQEGYKVDRALIHAFIRQESRFDPYAESHSGAKGLMQLMPQTAAYVATHRNAQERLDLHGLKNPQLNLELGQRYILTLMDLSSVNRDLFSLTIAYNAGPGNLRKWKRSLKDISGDPLLFVESVPAAETRAFVERVMANYWIYRLRLGQSTPSLDAIARGHWPRYQTQDAVKHAALPQEKPLTVANSGL